jgi:hypothetical protein
MGGCTRLSLLAVVNLQSLEGGIPPLGLSGVP